MQPDPSDRCQITELCFSRSPVFMSWYAQDLLGYRLDDAVDRARTSKGFISPSASTGRLRPRGASAASSVDGAFL